MLKSSVVAFLVGFGFGSWAIPGQNSHPTLTWIASSAFDQVTRTGYRISDDVRRPILRGTQSLDRLASCAVRPGCLTMPNSLDWIGARIDGIKHSTSGIYSRPFTAISSALGNGVGR